MLLESRVKKPLTLKTKVLVPVFSLITVILFLSGLILMSSYPRIGAMNRLDQLIHLGDSASCLLHALQKERGLSVGYVVSKDQKFLSDLYKQRTKTDHAIKKFIEKSNQRYYPDIRKHLTQVKRDIHNIAQLRNNIDTRTASFEKALLVYSKTNAALLKTILAIVIHSEVSSVAQHVLAYSHFLYLQEYAGLERAQGVLALSKRTEAKQFLVRLAELNSLQKEHALMFDQYASNKVKKLYKAVFNSALQQKIVSIEKKLMQGDLSKIDIEAKQWFDLMTNKIDRLDKINAYFQNDIQEEVEKELQDSRRRFQLVIVLLFASLVAFGIMLMSLMRLIKEEQRLRTVTEKYIISSTTDTRGIITDVSQAFCDISGYTKEELIGKPHNIVRHPDVPSEVFRQMWRELKTGRNWQGKVKNRKKDGGFYWVYANIEPLYNSRGQVNAYIAVRLDITESELLSEAIQEKERKYLIQQEMMHQQHRMVQMGEMLSMIAHQWRQPLAAITAAAGSIQLKARLGKLDIETARETAEKIQSFSLHLSSTIDDFRNFFKSNKSKVETSYPKIIESVHMIIDSSLEQHGIQWQEETKNVQSLWTYENELKQVVLNLFKNAEDVLVEKKIEHPYIKIRIDGNRLEVEDNGGGIPETILDQIFDPYFSTKNDKNGTGLGLYMSKLIIEDHCGGTLQVTNTDQGACFSIVLPEGEGG